MFFLTILQPRNYFLKIIQNHYFKIESTLLELRQETTGPISFFESYGGIPVLVPHFYRKKNKENIGRWHLAGKSGSSIKRRDFLQRTTHFFVKQKISCLNSFWSDPEGDKFLGAIPHRALRHLQSNSKFYPHTHRDSSHDIGFSRFPLINFGIMMDSPIGWLFHLLSLLSI